MHIVFGVVGHIEVEHGRHVFDVQTARGHVGTDQQIDFAFFEGFQSFQALVLALVAVQRSGFEAFALQRAGQTAATELAVDKNEGLFDTTVVQHLADHAALVVVLRSIKTLLHRRSRLVGTGHFDGDGVLQVAAGQALDLGREGGREQQRGALLGQVAQNALQVGQEADVQHAVGFVQHHIFHLIEDRVFGFDVVQQAAGGGHQHFNALFQLQGLGLHVHAAKHHRAAQLGVFGVHLDLLGDLVGQLTRGQQHQSAYRVARWRGGGVFVFEQALQQRQRKRRRFTGARLGCAHHVLACQHHRNGLGLDRGHGFVAHFGYGSCQRGRQR